MYTHICIYIYIYAYNIPGILSQSAMAGPGKAKGRAHQSLVQSSA